MIESTIYVNRMTGNKERESFYKPFVLNFLYGDSFISRIGRCFLPFIAKYSLFSRFYGWLQKCSFTKRKISPFILQYGIDIKEFLEPPETFYSFNDFFIRRLNLTYRPIAEDSKVAVIPADGRYFFYSDLNQIPKITVKNNCFSLESLLKDKRLAEEYSGGSLVLARLCPSDYHRFHFPTSGIPGRARLINGYYYSVNPLAIRKNFSIFSENKRSCSVIEETPFGKIVYLAIGATNVASIEETFTPDCFVHKGAERGFFQFGGSALILLFKKGTIVFDRDLLKATKEGYEIKCLMGQIMGRVLESSKTL